MYQKLQTKMEEYVPCPTYKLISVAMICRKFYRIERWFGVVQNVLQHSCVSYRLCVIQVWGLEELFNIGYVCYRCGDRQVSVQNTVCVLQVWEWVDLCLI